MDKNEYIDLFHKLKLNEVAFKPLFRCDDEVLKLVNAALAQRTSEEWQVAIVVECARFVDDYVAEAAGIHWDTGNSLKKHFGIEEKNCG